MKLRKILPYCFVWMVSFAQAQPRISANTEKFDFGRIEWKKPVKVEFIITNTGNKPLVMNNVIPSCSCTAVNWTKTPIEAGEKGKIIVSYDAEMLGHFDKEICVYSNATPNLVYLTFVGEVVRKINDYTSSHPYKIGNIAINKTSISFPDTKLGSVLTDTLNVVNLSDRPYEPVIMHLPSYITVKRSSDVLLKGQRGSIQLTLNTKKINDVGLTQSSIYLSRFNGDKVSAENEIPVSCIILPDFSKMTEKDKQKAPIIHISQSTINLGSEPLQKKIISKQVSISNLGKSPLVITKIQVLNSAIRLSLKKRVLQPKESTTIKISIHSRLINHDKNKLSIIIICDDPAMPKAEININK